MHVGEGRDFQWRVEIGLVNAPIGSLRWLAVTREPARFDIDDPDLGYLVVCVEWDLHVAVEVERRGGDFHDQQDVVRLWMSQEVPTRARPQ